MNFFAAVLGSLHGEHGVSVLENSNNERSWLSGARRNVACDQRCARLLPIRLVNHDNMRQNDRHVVAYLPAYRLSMGVVRPVFIARTDGTFPKLNNP